MQRLHRRSMVVRVPAAIRCGRPPLLYLQVALLIMIGLRRCVARNGSDGTSRQASEMRKAIGHLEDDAEPRVLLVALHRVAEARSLVKVASLPVSRARSFTGAFVARPPVFDPCSRRQSEGLKLTLERTIRQHLVSSALGGSITCGNIVIIRARTAGDFRNWYDGRRSLAIQVSQRGTDQWQQR